MFIVARCRRTKSPHHFRDEFHIVETATEAAALWAHWVETDERLFTACWAPIADSTDDQRSHDRAVRAARATDPGAGDYLKARQDFDDAVESLRDALRASAPPDSYTFTLPSGARVSGSKQACIEAGNFVWATEPGVEPGCTGQTWANRCERSEKARAECERERGELRASAPRQESRVINDVAPWSDNVKDEAARLAALSVAAPPPPPDKLTCNRHADCRAAEIAYAASHDGQPPLGSFHCHDDCCEDCFGQ